MFLAKVTGSVVSTQKVDSMVGQKLMMVQAVSVDKKSKVQSTTRSIVAVDTLGSGIGDMVLVTQGSSARLTEQTAKLPIDAIIVGIVDQVHWDNKCIFDRQDD